MSKRLIIKIIISISVCILVGVIGSLATQTTVDNWYVHLNKPFWSPPNWIFAPVWTILFIMMGIAAGLIWHKGFYHKWVKTAMYHFVFQLLLNAFWSILFFGFKQPFVALLNIIVLLILIALTIKWFRVVDKRAAILLVPYITWVLFATALNFEIWRLN